MVRLKWMYGFVCRQNKPVFSSTMTVWSNSYHAAFHFNIMMSSLVLGLMAYGNLSPHSTLFCKHPNRSFWSLYFLRFCDIFHYDIQSAHWKIGKNSFAFSTVMCLIWLSKIKVCRLVVRCAVYVFWLFHLFPHTAKWVYREYIQSGQVPIICVNALFYDFCCDSRTTHSTCNDTSILMSAFSLNCPYNPIE